MNNTNSLAAIQSLPFFFIIGRPRSGTTLFRTLFDAHSRVCIPVESPLIINLEKRYGKKTQWSPKDLMAFYQDLMDQHLFSTWKLDHEALKADLLDCAGSCSFTDLVRLVYARYQSFYPKSDLQLFGDKNPVYSMYVKKLMHLFPEAKFLHITRDYRDNYLSIEKVDFEAPIPALIAYRWKHAWQRMARLKKMAPERFYTIRYEDLVAAPEVEMKSICAFLGLEFESAMLDFYQAKEKSNAFYTRAATEKYHSSLMHPVDTSKVEKWRRELVPEKIMMMDYVVGQVADQAGYKRQYGRFSMALRLRALLPVTYGRLLFMAMRLGDTLPYAWRMAMVKRMPLLVKSYRLLAGLDKQQQL